MNPESGKYIVIIGIGVILIGIVIYFFHDRFNWIGRLPGDIRVERENFRFYFPVVTMILFSVIISVIIWIVKKML